MDNILTRADMDEWEQNEYIHENNTQHFKTNFNFLKQHKGWRPGKVHLVVAPTHAGKSTFVRSAACDFVVNNNEPNHRAMVWLSEESSEEFKTEFSKLRVDPILSRNLIIASEQDESMPTDQRKLVFSHALELANPSILIFDNATTSEFYADKGVEDQASFARFVKKKAKEKGIAVILIAHSGGATQLNKRLIELNDIRGGKTLVNLAEFAYVLQNFRVHDPETNQQYKFPTMRIEKHRGYVCDDILFKFRFSKETVSFVEDRVVPWEEFKEAFKNQMAL